MASRTRAGKKYLTDESYQGRPSAGPTERVHDKGYSESERGPGRYCTRPEIRDDIDYVTRNIYMVLSRLQQTLCSQKCRSNGADCGI